MAGAGAGYSGSADSATSPGSMCLCRQRVDLFCRLPDICCCQSYNHLQFFDQGERLKKSRTILPGVGEFWLSQTGTPLSISRKSRRWAVTILPWEERGNKDMVRGAGHREGPEFPPSFFRSACIVVPGHFVRIGWISAQRRIFYKCFFSCTMAFVVRRRSCGWEEPG